MSHQPFSPNDIRQRSFSYYPRLGQIQSFCELHYREEISLKRAANVIGLKGTYFSTFFSNKVGVGFANWLNYLRVTHAEELLLSDDRSIKDVAKQVGFGSYSTFDRAFKQCTGTTPSAYREEYRVT